MVCSAEVWAGRGPSPSRRRRELENTPPTPLHAAQSESAELSLSDAVAFSSSSGAGGAGGVAGGWRRPLPASASINVRLLDAAVQVFAATFGQQVGCAVGAASGRGGVRVFFSTSSVMYGMCGVRN